MATFYAKYPSTTVTVAGTSTVQGPGTAGAQSGGVLTVQGDPSGTAIPISGSITATNPSIGTPGAVVPASATMVGGSDGTNLRAVKVSATGVVSIDGSATTQPVSGTVTANQGTAGASAWLVDGSGHTQPISGTVTANAGTNLNTSALALDTSVNGILVSQGSTTSGEKGPLIQGAVTTAAPTYTTAQTSPLSLTTVGALRVDASGSTQPISGTVAVTQSTSPWVGNISQFGGNNVVTGTGASGNGIPRVTVSNDSSLASITTVSTVTAVTAISNALPAGGNTIGAVTQASGPWTVTGSGTAGSAAAGVVTIQGIASMTAVKVDGSAVTQPVSGTVTANAGTGTFTVAVATTTAAFQAEGSLAFGSITNAFQTIFTPSAATKILQMRNNTDVAISVSFDAGTTLNYVLDSGDQVSLDLLANQLAMSTTAIQIKYTVGAPTLGSVRINGCH